MLGFLFVAPGELSELHLVHEGGALRQPCGRNGTQTGINDSRVFMTGRRVTPTRDGVKAARHFVASLSAGLALRRLARAAVSRGFGTVGRCLASAGRCLARAGAATQVQLGEGRSHAEKSGYLGQCMLQPPLPLQSFFPAQSLDSGTAQPPLPLHSFLPMQHSLSPPAFASCAA